MSQGRAEAAQTDHINKTNRLGQRFKGIRYRKELLFPTNYAGKKINKYPDFKTWASIPHIIYTSKFKIDHRVGDAAL